MAKDVVYDLDAAAFSSDDFRMYQFKVLLALCAGGGPVRRADQQQGGQAACLRWRHALRTPAATAVGASS
jgi:hypothetical protein